MYCCNTDIPQVCCTQGREETRSHACIHVSDMAYGLVVEGAVTRQATGAAWIGGEVPM
jgi:hypothetical protein